MDVMDLIKSRRSCRSFKDKPIPKDIINKIIEAGIWAPSAMNTQEWKFVIVDKVDKIAKTALECVRKNKPDYTPRDVPDPIFYSAPLVIFITAPETNWSREDCALAAQNMMLFARSIDIGSCFIGMAKYLNDKPDVLKELDVKEGHTIYATVIFGYPTKWPEVKEREEIKDYI